MRSIASERPFPLMRVVLKKNQKTDVVAVVEKGRDVTSHAVKITREVRAVANGMESDSEAV